MIVVVVAGVPLFLLLQLLTKVDALLRLCRRVLAPAPVHGRAGEIAPVAPGPARWNALVRLARAEPAASGQATARGVALVARSGVLVYGAPSVGRFWP